MASQGNLPSVVSNGLYKTAEIIKELNYQPVLCLLVCHSERWGIPQSCCTSLLCL
jgi:hypothetical protein